MISYVYKSEAKVPFDTQALHTLTEQAAQKNKQLGITGYLWFRDGIFVQYIEGSKANVTLLMMSIEHDRRHEILVSCLRKDLKIRLFPSWYMRLFSDKEVNSMHFEYLVDRNLSYLQTTKERERTESLMWRQITSLAKFQNRMYN